MAPRPKIQAPAPVVEDTTAEVVPPRALPPAVMQDSPWMTGASRSRSSAATSGVGGTVLTAPGGLVPSLDTNMRGKTLLGS